MWPHVSVKDVEDRWRPLTDAEKTVAGTRIKDAEFELQYQLRERGFTTPLITDLLWSAMYVRTVADAARESILNPEGWSSETESIDDWSQTKRRDTDASVRINIPEDAVSKLIPNARRRRGAFSVTLANT